MPQNKKHHYVPKFYLRNFSADGVSIGIYNISSKRTIASGNLSNQCYRNYFYGKQPTIEHALAGIEGAAAQVISGLLSGQKPPPPLSSEHIVLSHFIVLQAARTAHAAEVEAEAMDKTFKTVYRNELGHLHSYRVGFDDPVLMSLRAASRVVPAVYDLKIKLLRNETQLPFATSDSPVVRHNQYYEGNDYFGQTGWAQAGLLVFLPLSPHHLCLFYDGETYKVGNKIDAIVTLNSTQDVQSLNALQWLNALHNIYFVPGYPTDALAKAAQIIPRRTKDKASVAEHPLPARHFPDDPPDTTRSLLHEFRHGLNIRLKVNCIKLRRHPKHPRFDDRASPVRDTDYLNIVDDFAALLAKNKAKPDGFLDFAAGHPAAQRRGSERR
jgi:Protein of unknown function (DUF4238)